MTPAPHNPEQDLSQTLARQADRFAEAGGSPLELDQVLSRAGEIRRGRRMRASMVMAAVVLAVAVPVGITTLGENDPTKPAPPPLATASPAPVDDSPLTFDGLKTGEAPRTAYVLDGKLYSGSLRPIDISDLGTTVEVARVKSGFLVASADPSNGDTSATFVGDDGVRLGTNWPYGSENFGVSGDREVGAFVEPDGTVIAVQDSGTLSSEIGKLPAGGAYEVAAVTGPDCTDHVKEPESCTVYVNDRGAHPKVWVVNPTHAASELGGNFLSLAGADTVFAGQISVDDLKPGSCSKATSTGFDELWKTCDYSLESFSPDGKYVLGGPAYQSGSADGQLAFLDSQTGKVLLTLRTGDNVDVWDARWEDSSHVLAVLGKPDSYAIVRIGLDGSRELAVMQTPGTEDFISPFKLG